MQSIKEATYLAPAIAARVVQFNNDGDLQPYVVVENTGSSASAAIRFQESDNGSTWSDISNTAATVLPGESNAQIIVSTKAKLALFAAGNVPISVMVVKQVNGAPSDLGTA